MTNNSNDNPKPPERLELTAAMQIEAAAGTGADGKPALPRFSMVAYTGGAMRIAGFAFRGIRSVLDIRSQQGARILSAASRRLNAAFPRFSPAP